MSAAPKQLGTDPPHPPVPLGTGIYANSQRAYTVTYPDYVQQPEVFAPVLDRAQQIWMVEKTALVDREPLTLNIDIAALQETRLADAGDGVWQCLGEGEHCIHGVGFAVRNKMVNFVNSPVAKSAQII